MTKQRILQYIEYKGITKPIFFKETGIKRGFLDADKLDSTVSDLHIASIIAAYPDINLEWLILGVGNMTKECIEAKDLNCISSEKIELKQEVQDIPLYDISAAAGCVELFHSLHDQVPIDTIRIPNLAKCDGAVFVRGDSMYPILKSGDIILYKTMPELDTIIWGETYIVSYESFGDYYTVVKYVKRSMFNDGCITLISQNEHHQPFEIKLSQVRAMALVRASIRYNNM